MPSTLSKAVIASALLGAVDASRDKVAGYAPGSKITSHNAIDLDVKAMTTFLGQESGADFVNAEKVYREGGNSKPYAEIEFDNEALSNAASKGDEVKANSKSGKEITLKFKKDYAQGLSTIGVTYPINSKQETYTGCKEGGLATKAGSKITDPYAYTADCIDATDPQLTIGGVAYTVKTITNKAGRTLNGFSTGAYDKMYRIGTAKGKADKGCYSDKDRDTDGCPYEEYTKFYNYYGSNYASKMVVAALTEGKTNFATWVADPDNEVGTSMPLGDMDFKGTAEVLRTQVAKKTAVYMSAYMYAIREFEDAIDDCQVGCHRKFAADGVTATDGGDCNSFSTDSVHAWDEGVAFYTGTLEGTEVGGNSAGQLSYRLAEKRCGNFKTCGPLSNDLTGVSYVNTRLFQLIDQGQVKLLMGECDAVKPIVDEMTAIMSVPLIQGTLRYAYKMEFLGGGPEERGEGAAFAASIVPAVHACDKAAAATIMSNMKVGAASTDFSAVKAAFEGCYSAMKIKCEDVGGLWFKGESRYYDQAAPCPRSVPLPDEAAAKEVVPTWGIVVIAIIAALFGIVVIGFCVLVMKERAGTPIFLKLEKGGSRA